MKIVFEDKVVESKIGDFLVDWDKDKFVVVSIFIGGIVLFNLIFMLVCKYWLFYFVFGIYIYLLYY